MPSLVQTQPNRACRRRRCISRCYRPARCASAPNRASLYLAVTHLEGLGDVSGMLQRMGSRVPDVLAVHSMVIIQEECPDHPSQVSIHTQRCGMPSEGLC